LWAYASFKGLDAHLDMQLAMIYLLRLVLSDIDFSANLSTPRGALTQYRELLYADVMVEKTFDDFLKKVDSGQVSSDHMQLFHLIAKQTCFATYSTVNYLKQSPAEDALKYALVLRQNMLGSLEVIMKAAKMKQVKDILKVYEKTSEKIN